MISTPIKQTTSDPTRLAGMRSRNASTAKSATHAGIVNSRANTVASGSRATETVHPICEAKCKVLRSACRRRRRSERSYRSEGRAANSASMTATPNALRTPFISNALNTPARARTESATVVNERSVPLIHRASQAISVRQIVEIEGEAAVARAVRSTLVVSVNAMRLSDLRVVGRGTACRTPEPRVCRFQGRTAPALKSEEIPCLPLREERGGPSHPHLAAIGHGTAGASDGKARGCPSQPDLTGILRARIRRTN